MFNVVKMDIDQQYHKAATTPSDINEHIPTLYEYASQCQHITECGVRYVVSTWAFLKGLLDNNSNNKKLISVDLDYSPNIKNIQDLANKNNVDFVFIMGNDVKITLEQTDLLFIDTWHVYGHLKRELNLHHHKVNKYIILHDTTVDAEIGESIRCNFNILQQTQASGYPVEEITKGLWPAVEEFLEENKDWELLHRYTNNNGLTILKRK